MKRRFYPSHIAIVRNVQTGKRKLEKLAKFKDIRIVDTAGVSTMYANNGGVIVAV